MRYAVRPNHGLPQDDELWHTIGATPYDRVLFESLTQRLGRFEIQAQDKEALLAGPVVRRMLADALDECQTTAGQFCPQRRLPLSVFRFTNRSAEWVAAREKCGTVHIVARVQRQQVWTYLSDLQNEGHLAMHAVVSLQVGLDGDGINNGI